MITVENIENKLSNLTKRIDVLDLAVDDLVETTDDDAGAIMKLNDEVAYLNEYKNNSRVIWVSQLIIDLMIVIHIIMHSVGGN